MMTCILLAAGESKRFGSTKAIAELREQNVIGILQVMLLSTQLDEIVIVLGAHANEIEPFLLHHKKINVVYNKSYNLGQTSSFQAGVKASSPLASGYLLLPVDFPFVQSETVNRIIETYIARTPQILLPTYHGKKGHPPVFNNTLKQELLGLPTSKGLNEIVHKYGENETLRLTVEDPGVISTFNTPEEWAALKRDFEGGYGS